jgi:hypothetical protein
VLKIARLLCVLGVSALLVLLSVPAHAQQTLGAINGTVSDQTGAVVQKAAVKIRNIATNLEVTAATKDDGSFAVVDLPIGTYEVTFTKDGFKKEVYSQILVQGSKTATVNAKLSPGAVSSTVTVEATPLLNETDTSNGYTVGSELAQEIPLGTGSFTQLAILAPGVSADFLSGSGSNEGLGNQAIVANGQRPTSNSVTFNAVNANNLFNGNTTSYISTSRFILNTGENFAAGGQVQTNTSVFDAIGQGLPTPPVETIEELHVSTSMYNASQGSTSGAHLELTTKSGTNDLHGQAYEYFQSNAFDATPTFLTQNPFFSGAPPLHRNVFGGTLGGPIKKDKLFFFGSYQGQRITDALNGSLGGAAVPIDPNSPGTTLGNLSDDRSAPTLAAVANQDFGTNLTAGDVDSAALAILNAKTPSGQFIIPSVNRTAETGATPFSAFVKGQPSTFNADQANGNIDYILSSKDRLAAKYYFQNDPSTSPFAVSQVLGFPQSLKAGSQVFSFENTVILTPNATWEQRIGFIREVANATTGQALTPSAAGINLLGSTFFPGIAITNADGNFHELRVGPSTNFANAGIFQNQFEAASAYHWVAGRHSVAFGFSFDYGQLNVLNRENKVATFTFRNFPDFLTGTLGQDRSNGRILDGETNRHFASKQAGLYAQDDIKVKSNLTVNLGLRWDWDGPLYEKNGLLTNFYPSDYNYSLNTDSFGTLSNNEPGIGLVVAGNNKAFGFKGVSDSTLTGRQWMFAPRIGVAWSPSFLKNFVIRAGAGLYADRGEYFTEFSPSAGLGISGPFGVTTEEPFTIPFNATCVGTGCLASNPFGTAPLPAPPTNLSGVAPLIHDLRDLAGCFEQPVPGQQQPGQPYCPPNAFGPPTFNPPPFAFLFGGYNPANKLPYSENWSLDLQWQPRNDLVLTLGYVGNHGVHEVLPIPFNQPGIATPQNPINNQIYSYGYLAATPTVANGCDSFNDPSSTCIQLPPEAVQTTIGEFAASDGNTALRTPFVGFNPNSDSWIAAGISNYNALQFQLTKRISHNFTLSASYTYSHSLDEGGGLGSGLFFNGNNPLALRSSYGNSDFDRKHVFIVNYLYQFPKLQNASRFVDAALNGWAVSGVTVVQSGQPYSIIDFSGTAGGLFFSADDFVTNPILPLASGTSPSQAVNTNNRVNGLPYVNPNDFSVPLLNPGQDGVPPCQTVSGTQICDNFETGFGNNGRDIFRSPSQVRFDFSITKNFKVTERIGLKFEADAFNLFNHPSLDAPFSNFSLNQCFNPVPCYSTSPDPSQGFGVIQSTIGSPRFMQMSLHLTF